MVLGVLGATSRGVRTTSRIRRLVVAALTAALFMGLAVVTAPSASALGCQQVGCGNGDGGGSGGSGGSGGGGGSGPAPATPGPVHDVCNPFCNRYLSRSVAKAEASWIAANGDIYKDSVAAATAVFCAAAGVGGVVPGLICAGFAGLLIVDIDYAYQQFAKAAASGACIRLPLYVPWWDPIVYTGTECTT